MNTLQKQSTKINSVNMISLQDLIDEGSKLSRNYYEKYWGINCVSDEALFFEWSSKSLMLLQEQFPNHPQTNQFEKYVQKGETSVEICNKMVAILRAFGAINPSTKPILYDEILANIFNHFHIVAKQLKRRYNQRHSIELNDEYDVQDLLHALLKLHFEDVRPEEWTPSYAGGNNRMDFLIKDEEIAIEVKMTRKGLKDKEVGEQLIIDIAKYQSHPNCKRLYCFVYDKDEVIRNPRGIEKDLESQSNDLAVKVFIRPL